MAFSFITPYNFIPLGKPAHEENLPWQKEGEKENQGKPEKMTGKIDYTLTTLSPLFIPNTSNDRVFSTSDKDLEGSTEDSPVYHKSFEFFSYENFADQKDLDQGNTAPVYAPVIPGTEIRGAVRSAYEALTDSCLSAIDLDAVLSKRTPEYFTPGILEWDGDGWDLYRVTNEADYLYRANHREDFSVKTFQTLPIQDGVEVTFIKDTEHAPYRDINARNAKPLADKVLEKRPAGPMLRDRLAGYLVKGENGPDLGKPPKPKCKECPPKTKTRCGNENAEHCYLAEKHCAHIFVKSGKAYRQFNRSDVSIYTRQISQILKIYRDNQKSPYTEYAKTWNEFMSSRRKGIPVYFSEIDGGRFFFSPACVTREVYLNTLKDIIGNYAPCDETTKCVCPACRLFGTIHNGLHIRSRLRFSDLHLAKETFSQNPSNVFMPVATLPELSTPKMSSTEFYLQMPTADNIMNWTYDYYITVNGEKWNLTAYTPVISGRKFYWHSDCSDRVVFSQQGKIEVNERNKTVRPVKDKISFRGTVYFDGVSQEELREIIAILNMSTFGEEGRYAIKLGSAKPLGFGSTALRINSVKIRSVKVNKHGISHSSDDYDFGSYNLSVFKRDDVIKAFDTQALTTLEKTGAVVTYPKKNPDSEGFDWFMSNRFAGKADRRNRTVDLGASTGGPQFRWQIAYRQYMQPLNPELLDNPVLKNKNNKCGAENADSNLRGNNTPSNEHAFRSDRTQTSRSSEKRSSLFSVGETMDGIVSGHQENSQGKYMFANVEVNGRSIKIHIRNFQPRIFGDIREKIPAGSPVKVTYKGKNSNGYDDWECRLIK